MSPLDIRCVTAADLGAAVELGTEMRAESAVGWPTVDAGAVARYLALAGDNPDVLYTAIAWRDGVPAGFVSGVLGTYPFSDRRRASCEFLFVRPAARGGVAARRLLRGFCGWAEARGARDILFGVSTGVAPERTGRFIEAEGFLPLGRLYRKEIDDVHGT